MAAFIFESQPKSERILMKEWRVYYSRKYSEGFDTRAGAVAFIRKTIVSGGYIYNIKHKGRNVLATTVFVLLGQAKLKLMTMPNLAPEPPRDLKSKIRL